MSTAEQGKWVGPLLEINPASNRPTSRDGAGAGGAEASGLRSRLCRRQDGVLGLPPQRQGRVPRRNLREEMCLAETPLGGP